MQEEITSQYDTLYPVLLIPKNCTNLVTQCEATDNVFIDLNITSVDTDGNVMSIYNGFCNVKLIDSYDVNEETSYQSSESYDNISPIIVTESTPLSNSSFNQSQVWIDPARSPYVYNSYDAMESQECYSVYNTNSGQITFEQHNTYITQNVYNYKETTDFAPEPFEHKKFGKVQMTDLSHAVEQPIYKDDEFECGVFLSQLSEEILNEQETRGNSVVNNREERISGHTDNGALKQLMSSDIQSLSKQQKTILYLGKDSHYGHTVQNIAINDPSMECVDTVVDREISNDKYRRNKKKYQCDKCKKIFYHLTTFKQHVVASHKSRYSFYDIDPSDVTFTCTECGKNFKNQEKFEFHCLGHGDPELECPKCRKVFASKFTLRTHSKIHTRKYSCGHCSKTYARVETLRVHMAKVHFTFMCSVCEFTTNDYSVLNTHKKVHKKKSTSDTESTLSVEEVSEASSGEQTSDDECDDKPKEKRIKEANSVIAKVMNNKMFLLHSKKARRHRKYNKRCDVCQKNFDRVGDLKRHLIEHVIRSTLAKTPVSKYGTLTIQCEICLLETFTKVDKYKAHLREHAKLTIYKCTFCDKTFSDSSNFSKHKKIHGTMFFQCDLCQRKFNSKKMIAQHMEYHKNHSPLPCFYCDKKFHFESMLNKHIKCAHTRGEVSKFRCRFCHEYYKSLKEKWDHEWKIHNVRKLIIDCLICGAQFRKYSELKRHCTVVHEVDIPLAKKVIPTLE